MTLRLSFVVAVLSLAAPGRVSAQDVEGPGHRIGDSALAHPTVGLETGFVSNVFYQESDVAGGTVSSPVIRVLAGVAIASNPADGRSNPSDEGQDDSRAASGSTLAYRFGAGLSYIEYLTDNRAAGEQSDLGVKLEGLATVFPRGTVTFIVQDEFVRDTRPTNFESVGNVNRDVNRLRLAVRWRPPGRTVWGTARYENTIDVFESDAIDFADRIQHTLGLRADWQYLPITRFYADVSQGIYAPLGTSEFGGAEFKRSSFPLRVKLGAATLFTERTSLRAHVGWGIGFYEAGADFNSFLFGGEFGYRFSPLGRAVVGIERNFVDSINANFFTEYKPYVRVEQQLGLVLAKAGAEYRRRKYRGVSPLISGMATTRTDDIFAVTGSVHYYYRAWLAAYADYRLAAVSTDFRTPDDDDPGYTRQEFWVGARAAF